MGDCFSSSPASNCLVSSKKEKRKKKRNPTHYLYTVLESFEYPLARRPSPSIDGNMLRHFKPEG